MDAFEEEMFYAEHTRVLKRIGDALVEATPEWWREASLELKIEAEGCSHSIKNNRHPNDLVVPTDELYEATFELERLFEHRQKMWRSAVMRAEEVAGSWEYTIDYVY